MKTANLPVNAIEIEVILSSVDNLIRSGEKQTAEIAINNTRKYSENILALNALYKLKTKIETIQKLLDQKCHG